MKTQVLELDVQVLSLVASVVIPGLVAWLAKRQAPSWFKALTNGLLSVAAGALAVAIAADGKVELWDWVMQAIITYGLSELSYQRVWKPTGAAAKVSEVAPGGIGPEEPDEAAPRKARAKATKKAAPRRRPGV